MVKKRLKKMVAMLAVVSMLAEIPFNGMVLTKAEQVNDFSTVSSNDIMAEEDIELVEGVEKTYSLNYLYIEKEQISKNESQTVVASLMSDGMVKQAKLLLVNKETQEELFIDAQKIVDNVAQFSVGGNELKSGIYEIRKIGCKWDLEDESEASLSQDSLCWVDFAEIAGLEHTAFGVDAKVNNDENSYIPIEKLAEMDGELSAEMAAFAESEAMSLVETNIVDLRDSKVENASEQVAAAIKEANAQMTGKSGQTADEITAEKVTAGSLVIVLDPGHDDTHAGASRYGLKEEQLTFKIASYCKQFLETNYTNVVVYLTRNSGACPHPGTTSTVDNGLRVADAKSVGADIYVSFHIDATGTSSTSASGSTVYYPNANYNSAIGMSGASLATMISQQLAKLGLNSNGIRIRNSENNTTYPDGSLADYLGVIRQSKENGITAVLIEHAYINNPNDAAYLANEENLKSMGNADGLGIGKAYNLSSEEVEYDAADLTVTDIDGVNGSFKITLKGATPVERIKDIKFKVNPVDDSSKSYLYTATADKKTKGTYSIVGNVTNHGNMTGKYKVIAYAYDAAGRKAQLRSTTFTINEAALNTDNMQLLTKLDKKQANATITLTNNSGAASLNFKVYSNENGKDDIKTYEAKKLDNGNWQAKVAISNHKSAGEYTIEAYSKSFFGKTKKVKTGSFVIDGPTIDAIRVKKINLNKGTFELRTDNLDSRPGISDVKITVKNLSGKRKKKEYVAKKNSSGDYYVTVDMKDHDYQLGRYQITVTATDKNSVKKQVISRKYDFGTPTYKITAKPQSKQTKISMAASDLGINAAIEGVQFRVFNATTKSKKKSYEAKKNGNGVWTATALVSDFKKAGNYKVSTFVKKKGGSYQRVGEIQKVAIADVTGGILTARTKGKKCYLYVSDIKSVSNIASVEITTWPEGKKSAKYTYKAKEQDDGRYRTLLETKKHGGKTGIYRYVVTVTLKNGIVKEVSKGRYNASSSVSDVDDSGYYSITGESSVTVSQMMSYYNSYASYPSFYASTDAPNLKKFCTIYYNECEAEGIKAEVAFAQAMKETNFLRYTGDVGIEQFNFAGIGATGGGAKGNYFGSVTEGIRAQIQHLKAYANTESLVKGCVDPRFTYVSRGTAPYVEWLGIPDNPYGKGWATAQNYGSSMLAMIKIMKSL